MTRDALIIAHGQPSAPDGPEAEIGALAAQVEAALPGWRVRGATLAAPDALEIALAETAAPVVFPFFMSDGWFIRTALPERLAAAGRPDLTIRTPFGLLPATRALAEDVLRRALLMRGWPAEKTRLICAAHGSGRSARPAQTARALAEAAGAALGFAELRYGFIEEPPPLTEALAGTGQRALCLPLFVAHWGHVREDLPAAVAAAGFEGAVLPPLGADPGVPDLIAHNLAGLD